MKPRGKGALLPGVLLTALGVWACDSHVTTPAPEQPRLTETASTALYATGGGRVDYPPGGFNKQSKQKHYQTWGFTFKDQDGVPGPDEGSRISLIDHRRELRTVCGGNPCHFRSIAISSIEPENAKCETPGKGVRVKGTVEETNTPEKTFPFEAEICDNGEPGRFNFESSSQGSDRFEFYVQGFVDPQFGQYCIHEFDTGPCNQEEDLSRGAFVTGGNIQVR